MYPKFKYPALVLALGFVACKAKVSTQAGPPPPVSVSVITVKDTVAGSYDEYPATVAALNEVKLTAQVSG